MLPVLRRLAERRWIMSELVESIADEYQLGEEERRTLLPSGRQTRIANRTHWAVAYLNRAGLIVRVARGQYEAADAGRTLLLDPPDRITISYLQRFPEFAGFRDEVKRSDGAGEAAVGHAPTDNNPSQNATPEERLEAANNDLRAELAAALLANVRQVSPAAFEQLIIDLLLKMGYGGSRSDAAKHLGRSGDGGIDGVIREDALGLNTIYLQAKRYAEDNSIGAPAIQGFAGALLEKGATKGVFVTTSRFTSQAKHTQEALKSHRLVLIDGVELARLMIEHDVGVRTVQTIKVQRIDLETYEGEEIS
jgi:restriction system protein